MSRSVTIAAAQMGPIAREESRQSAVAPKAIEPDALVAGFLPMLRRLVGEVEEPWRVPGGFVGWFRVVDHRTIGVRYICTAFVFFVLAGLLAASALGAFGGRALLRWVRLEWIRRAGGVALPPQPIADAPQFGRRIVQHLASRVDLPPDAGDFALMDRKVVDALNALPENNRFLRGLRSWVGFRQAAVHY